MAATKKKSCECSFSILLGNDFEWNVSSSSSSSSASSILVDQQSRSKCNSYIGFERSFMDTRPRAEVLAITGTGEDDWVLGR